MNQMLARTAVERALQIVENRESDVRAWRFIDVQGALDEADRVDNASHGPLHGIVLGVKDIFDTADQPTEYGSSIFSGFRPRADAGAVALLRSAGAVCLGKTVTAELACSHPGPTTNPHRSTHTPGGSSMGSAAAVASGMADVALGTQTAGSITRPASFCGVYGFKPTFGTVSVAGVKPVAPSLDTVGWFARTPELLDRVRVCLTGRLPLVPRLDPPRLAMLRFSDPEMRSADSQQALSRFAALATSAGASVVEISLPESYVHLYADQPIVMAYEAARSFTWERLYRTSGLSTELLELLEKGTSIDPQVYDLARSHKALALSDEEELFSGADALITPAALGEAPEGLESTGDPRFSRLWTLVGSPTVAVPVTTGITGLPIGIQLIGRLGDDSRLLGIAQWCSRLLEGINSGGSIIAH